MHEKLVAAIDAELDVSEMVLADPLTLRRLKSERIARRVLAVLGEPDAEMLLAGNTAIEDATDCATDTDTGAWQVPSPHCARDVLTAMLATIRKP